MARIIKHADAPEGDLHVSIAGEEFTVGADGYETYEAYIIESAETSPLLDVEDRDAPDPDAPVEEQPEDAVEPEPQAPVPSFQFAETGEGD